MPKDWLTFGCLLLIGFASLPACGDGGKGGTSSSTPWTSAGGAGGGSSGGSSSSTSTSTGSTGTGGAGGSEPCTPGATESCYSGPAGTEGVGLCVGGTRTCNPSGTGFGPCEGEVVPAGEDCSSPADEDCDGQVAPACSGDTLWAQTYGPAVPRALAVVSSGRIAIAGTIDGKANFGNNPVLTSAGGLDAFVAAFDTESGSAVWAERFGDGSDQIAWGAAADGNGNVVVVGEFAGSMDIGGTTLTSAGGSDAFVMAFNPDGDVLWSRRFGDAAAQAARGVAIDPEGNVFVIGDFAGVVDFGGETLESAGNLDVFVLKMSSQGSRVWSKRFGDGAEQDGMAIAVDAWGRPVIAGSFRSGLDFGGGPIVSAGGFDAFVAKLDGNGAHLQSKRFGDSGQETATQIVVGPDGAPVMAGLFWGSIDLGGGPFTTSGTYSDVFVARFDELLDHVSSRTVNGVQQEWVGGLAVDGAGYTLVAGGFEKVVDFGGQLDSAGKADVFVAKLDIGATPVWKRSFGNAGQDQIGAAVAVDLFGHVFVTGAMNGKVDFGTGSLNANKGDAFLVKLSP